MQHQREVAARFSAAASTYDHRATVQQAVAGRVAALAAGLPAVAHWLEIGCGTGLLTEQLVAAFPECFVHAVDVSPAMVRAAQARLAGCGRVLWIVGDLDSVRSGRAYDGVVSSSALHWLAPVDAAFSSIAGLVAPGGHLVFGMMVDGTLKELHTARKAVAPEKIPDWQLPRAEAVLGAIGAAGLEILQSRVESIQDVCDSASAFLRGLHDHGLTGGRFSSGETLLTRGELRRLTAEYDRRFRCDAGGVVATYDVLYVVARRPAPGRAEEGNKE